MGEKLLAALLAVAVTCAGAAPGVPTDTDPPVRGTSYELGRVILTLMPDRGQRTLSWDHRADSAVGWVDPGYKTVRNRLGEFAVRRGLIRTNVLGKRATVLRQRREELWWTVTYLTKGPPKFGPEKILLDPGGLSDVCFGTLYEGCEYDPLPSLRAAGIRAKQVCHAKIHEAHLTGFTLMHPGRGEIQLLVMDDGGSGGSSTSLEMRFSTPQELCTLER